MCVCMCGCYSEGEINPSHPTPSSKWPGTLSPGKPSLGESTSLPFWGLRPFLGETPIFSPVQLPVLSDQVPAATPALPTHLGPQPPSSCGSRWVSACQCIAEGCRLSRLPSLTQPGHSNTGQGRGPLGILPLNPRVEQTLPTQNHEMAAAAHQPAAQLSEPGPAGPARLSPWERLTPPGGGQAWCVSCLNATTPSRGLEGLGAVSVLFLPHRGASLPKWGTACFLFWRGEKELVPGRLRGQGLCS